MPYPALRAGLCAIHAQVLTAGPFFTTVLNYLSYSFVPSHFSTVVHLEFSVAIGKLKPSSSIFYFSGTERGKSGMKKTANIYK